MRRVRVGDLKLGDIFKIYSNSTAYIIIGTFGSNGDLWVRAIDKEKVEGWIAADTIVLIEDNPKYKNYDNKGPRFQWTKN